MSFWLSITSHVECYLTDIAGRMLIEIYNQDFVQGQQTNILDISSLQPGVYIVCFKVENKEIKQIVCERIVILLSTNI